ncbi:MAG: hypothetical protein ACTHQM_02385 [Thermoanaerobaculia bacterium]
MQDARLLGTWRQIRPDPAPAQIAITFTDDGALTYELRMEQGTQTFAMSWRVEGELLIVTNERDAPNESRFRFASPTMLIVERGDERHVYRRDDALA